MPNANSSDSAFCHGARLSPSSNIVAGGVDAVKQYPHGLGARLDPAGWTSALECRAAPRVAAVGVTGPKRLGKDPQFYENLINLLWHWLTGWLAEFRAPTRCPGVRRSYKTVSPSSSTPESSTSQPTIQHSPPLLPYRLPILPHHHHHYNFIQQTQLQLPSKPQWSLPSNPPSSCPQVPVGRGHRAEART